MVGGEHFVQGKKEEDNGYEHQDTPNERGIRAIAAYI